MTEHISIKGTVEKVSIDEILKHLNSDNIKDIIKNREISSVDRRKFEKILDYRIVYSDIKDHEYKFIAKKGTNYIEILLNVYRKHINSELEAFTLDLDKALFYIKDSKYNNLVLQLTMTEATPVKLEAVKYYEKDIEKYSKEEIKIRALKQVSIDKMEKELEELYRERMIRIENNKNLYNDLKNRSKDYYSSSSRSEEEKKEYKNIYKKTLGEVEVNKKNIIEIADKINILEKKKTLYTSGVYIFQPFSAIEIKSIPEDQGKNYESLENPTLPSTKKRIIRRKGGDLYDLEYLEIPETFSRSIESNFGRMKREIKKYSKKTSKNDILNRIRF